MRARRALALRDASQRPSPTGHVYRVIAGELSFEFQVLASNWLEALGHALTQLGEPVAPIALERVDLADRTVLVRLLGTGRSFCVQRIVSEELPVEPARVQKIAADLLEETMVLEPVAVAPPPSPGEVVVPTGGLWELLSA